MKYIVNTGLALLLLAGATGLPATAWPPRIPSPTVSQRSKSEDIAPTGNVVDGLSYLVKNQNQDGSWSQGEESPYMAQGGHHNGDIHNVADTCMAALALVRAGNLPDRGKFASNVAKAAEYVCASVEKADRDSLFITDVRGTRVQMKLGQFVDTFLAAVFLPEVKGHMKSASENERIATALNKIVYKIEKNQGADGRFANGGWAPIHSQSLALQGLNKAKNVGIAVKASTIERAETLSQKQFDSRNKEFNMDGAAGVGLYAAGATLGGMQSSLNTFNSVRGTLEAQSKDPTASPQARSEAAERLQYYSDAQAAQTDALAAVTKKLGDSKFVQGFGCNGGEEFLSYLQISDTMRANNDKGFDDWNSKITANLNHVQNQDGSWMGQHCITSRTFCTAAALLVLLAEKTEPGKNIANSSISGTH